MKHYADSSFLVSCYLTDSNTAIARNWLARATVSLPFTDLHALEVPNALRLGVFRQLISAARASAVLAEISNDLAAGRLIKLNVDWVAAFRVATRLSEQHSADNGGRSLDILHVAIAKATGAVGFLTFDKRQLDLAMRAGLNAQP